MQLASPPTVSRYVIHLRYTLPSIALVLWGIIGPIIKTLHTQQVYCVENQVSPYSSMLTVYMLCPVLQFLCTDGAAARSACDHLFLEIGNNAPDRQNLCALPLPLHGHSPCCVIASLTPSTQEPITLPTHLAPLDNSQSLCSHSRTAVEVSNQLPHIRRHLSKTLPTPLSPALLVTAAIAPDSTQQVECLRFHS